MERTFKDLLRSILPLNKKHKRDVEALKKRGNQLKKVLKLNKFEKQNIINTM